MSKKIAIVNYRCGNIKSVVNALNILGAECVVIDKPAALESADKIILPGVGAFSVAMKYLEKSGFREVLEQQVLGNGTPILGICLGMQLMCNSSDEHGLHQGLGWIDADVRLLQTQNNHTLKVPHMGWNALTIHRQHALTSGLADQADVYFVHSHAVHCHHEEDVVCYSQYGQQFVSMFARDNIFGMQFHPEKSHKVGLKILKDFVGLVPRYEKAECRYA